MFNEWKVTRDGIKLFSTDGPRVISVICFKYSLRVCVCVGGGGGGRGGTGTVNYLFCSMAIVQQTYTLYRTSELKNLHMKNSHMNFKYDRKY